MAHPGSPVEGTALQADRRGTTLLATSRRCVIEEATIDKELRTLTGWERRSDRIVKTFMFDDFRSAMKFVGRVADAAVAVDDEVEIEVRSNRVTLAVSTPGAETITGSGLALAAASIASLATTATPSAWLGPEPAYDARQERRATGASRALGGRAPAATASTQRPSTGP